jgi:hypothetical protein
VLEEVHIEWQFQEFAMQDFRYFLSMTVTAMVLIVPQKAANAQQTALELHCSQEADARGLHSVERKEFRTRCKAGAAETAPASIVRSQLTHTKPAVDSRPQQLTGKPANEPQQPKSAARPDASTSPQQPVATIMPPASAPSHAAPPIAANGPPAAGGRRIALVIGNSAYRNVPALTNPQRDAALVADALRRTGFETVNLQIDAARDGLVGALRDFAQQAETADWAVVYYAGHGMEVGGINYLIPVDAKIVSDRDISFEAVPLNQVLNAAERARKLRLVILDACRDNPFASQMKRTMTVASRSVSRGLAAVEPEAGSLVVFAAKDGETALDGDGVDSPFTLAFLKNLQTPGLEVRRLFDYVRDDVMDATQRKQQPFSYGSISGRQDFYFVAAK